MKFKRICCFLMLLFILLPFTCVHAEDSKYKITSEDQIYYLMTDRFNDGDTSNDTNTNKSDMQAYHGGDFQGIIDKLDYIKDLGFTTIWISPVMENQSGGYHGYWTTDYYKTNEHFGSMDKLKELVKTAHSKNIKVIFDLVINHTGQMHPWLDDPKYANWYHDYMDITDYNNQEQVENGRLSRLPDLNTENPEVKKYLIDMAKWWIKETGVDGYRLDAARHVPKDFWKEFTSEIKKDYPDFYFLGEVYNGDISYVGGYQGAGIDGLLDFPLYYSVNDVFKNSKPAATLADAINKASSYSNRYLMGTFIDNHDVPRFVNQINTLKEERLKSALVFEMTYTGIPVVYYGTEVAMEGGFDPDNRRDMDFAAASPVKDFLKNLSSIRKGNTALTKGDIKVLKSDSEFLCYSRKYENNTVIVALNTSEKQKKAEFNIPETDTKQTLMTDLISQKNIKIKNGKAALDLAPMQSCIFVYKDNPVNYSLIILCFAVLVIAAAVIIFAVRKRKLKASK